MASLSLTLADIAGKAIDLQRQLALEPSPSNQLINQINDIHFLFDNVYRSYNKREQPTTATATDGATSSELVILSPTDTAHQAFAKGIHIKQSKHNPLPWMHLDVSLGKESKDKPTWRADARYRIQKNTNTSTVVKRRVRRHVVSQASSERSRVVGEVNDEDEEDDKVELDDTTSERNLEVTETYQEKVLNSPDDEVLPNFSTTFSSILAYRPKSATGSFIIREDRAFCGYGGFGIASQMIFRGCRLVITTAPELLNAKEYSKVLYDSDSL
ncbi:uncharacterized protein LY89DRAFT_676521 [Mollisia scopiformis]|uniref:Uncharacterized protein n=1 Tax=Mollisia scopiformis TaxID=149040 RepID=A0A132B9S7_MOLSC|nr:uncharacterized protein LY89DRAFT_676521 [Mollisia scopiformis]KUJ09160.1 hypothetical protein LY89DRAFT_676521 [Mollisia scopiformis]